MSQLPLSSDLGGVISVFFIIGTIELAITAGKYAIKSYKYITKGSSRQAIAHKNSI
jgi:hypothetical protein